MKALSFPEKRIPRLCWFATRTATAERPTSPYAVWHSRAGYGFPVSSRQCVYPISAANVSCVLPLPRFHCGTYCARYLPLLILLTRAAVPGFALDPGKTLTQYAHRTWGQEEGLFQPTIYSIVQTRGGFLWLGTQDSLISFDGQHFREFQDSKGDTLHHNLIRALAEDGSGNLWVGSIGGGAAVISPYGRLTRYTQKDGLPSENVFCLDASGHSDMWLCTSAGLARFSESKLLRVYSTADGLPSNEIRGTCQTPDGTRWVGGINFGLARWTGSRFASLPELSGPAKDGVTALSCAADGSVWAGTNSGLVHVVPDSHSQASRLLNTRDGLPDNLVSSLVRGADGSLWIGTNDGISRYRNGQINVYRTRDGLSHSSVLSLYLDREGSLWAGTKDGLDQFTDGKVTPYTTGEGLSGNDVGPVLEDATGRLWIGTLAHGLNYLEDGRFHALTTRDGLTDNHILSLERDASGDIWVGTAHGLNRLRDARVVERYFRNNGLSGDRIRAVFVDTSGRLWVGTDRGLNHLDGGHFVADPVEPGAPLGEVLALGGSHLTRLFVSTDHPAFFTLRNDTFASYSMDVMRPIDCYLLDSVHHSAWMGTLGSGLLRWHNGSLVHVRVKDGLYDNRIYSISRDEKANLWMASSKGIFRVSEKDLNDFADGKLPFVTSIPFSTGQLRFECQSGVQPAAYRTQDGRLWFSTTSGLVVVDPNHLATNQVPPPVQITAVLVNGRPVDWRGELKVMPWEEKNFEICYAGLTFVSPQKVDFRYILEGYDRSWTDAGSRHEAFFTNLPPGQFRFKVLARNADGVWSKHAATLSLTVEPHLYQRLWFFPMLAALLGLATVVVYRLRIQQLRHRFELVLAERNRIARELHDTLLQGLSGITMQLQALWTRLPASREKQFLGEVIKSWPLPFIKPWKASALPCL